MKASTGKKKDGASPLEIVKKSAGREEIRTRGGKKYLGCRNSAEYFVQRGTKGML